MEDFFETTEKTIDSLLNKLEEAECEVGKLIEDKKKEEDKECQEIEKLMNLNVHVTRAVPTAVKNHVKFSEYMQQFENNVQKKLENTKELISHSKSSSSSDINPINSLFFGQKKSYKDLFNEQMFGFRERSPFLETYHKSLEILQANPKELNFRQKLLEIFNSKHIHEEIVILGTVSCSKSLNEDGRNFKKIALKSCFSMLKYDSKLLKLFDFPSPSQTFATNSTLSSNPSLGGFHGKLFREDCDKIVTTGCQITEYPNYDELHYGEPVLAIIKQPRELQVLDFLLTIQNDMFNSAKGNGLLPIRIKLGKQIKPDIHEFIHKSVEDRISTLKQAWTQILHQDESSRDQFILEKQLSVLGFVDDPQKSNKNTNFFTQYCSLFEDDFKLPSELNYISLSKNQIKNHMKQLLTDAKMMTEMKDYDNALSLYSRALKCDATNLEAQFGRPQMLMRLRKFNDAIQEMERLISNPDLDKNRKKKAQEYIKKMKQEMNTPNSSMNAKEKDQTTETFPQNQAQTPQNHSQTPQNHSQTPQNLQTPQTPQSQMQISQNSRNSQGKQQNFTLPEREMPQFNLQMRNNSPNFPPPQINISNSNNNVFPPISILPPLPIQISIGLPHQQTRTPSPSSHYSSIPPPPPPPAPPIAIPKPVHNTQEQREEQIPQKSTYSMILAKEIELEKQKQQKDKEFVEFEQQKQKEQEFFEFEQQKQQKEKEFFEFEQQQQQISEENNRKHRKSKERTQRPPEIQRQNQYDENWRGNIQNFPPLDQNYVENPHSRGRDYNNNPHSRGFDYNENLYSRDGDYNENSHSRDGDFHQKSHYRDREPRRHRESSNERKNNIPQSQVFAEKEKKTSPSSRSSSVDKPISKEIEKIPKENERIPKENEKIPKENEKIPKEIQKIPKETEKIPKENEKIPKEIEKSSKEKGIPPKIESISKEIGSPIPISIPNSERKENEQKKTNKRKRLQRSLSLSSSSDGENDSISPRQQRNHNNISEIPNSSSSSSSTLPRHHREHHREHHEKKRDFSSLDHDHEKKRDFSSLDRDYDHFHKKRRFDQNPQNFHRNPPKQGGGAGGGILGEYKPNQQ